MTVDKPPTTRSAMTDDTERKVRQWAMRINGEPLTNRDVVELVLAVDEDADSRHRRISETVRETQEQHEELCKKVAEIEQKLSHVMNDCNGHIEAIVREDHEKLHGEHMALFHKQIEPHLIDTNDNAFKTLYMWTVGSKVSAAIIVILTGLSVVIFGEAIAQALGLR